MLKINTPSNYNKTVVLFNYFLKLDYFTFLDKLKRKEKKTELWHCSHHHCKYIRYSKKPA